MEWTVEGNPVCMTDPIPSTFRHSELGNEQLVFTTSRCKKHKDGFMLFDKGRAVVNPLMATKAK